MQHAHIDFRVVQGVFTHHRCKTAMWPADREAEPDLVAALAEAVVARL